MEKCSQNALCVLPPQKTQVHRQAQETRSGNAAAAAAKAAAKAAPLDAIAFRIQVIDQHHLNGLNVHRGAHCACNDYLYMAAACLWPHIII